MDSFNADAFCNIACGGRIIACQEHGGDSHSFQLFHGVCRIFTHHIGKCNKSHKLALSVNIDNRCAFGKLFIDSCLVRRVKFSNDFTDYYHCSVNRSRNAFCGGHSEVGNICETAVFISVGFAYRLAERVLGLLLHQCCKAEDIIVRIGVVTGADFHHLGLAIGQRTCLIESYTLYP